jgi:hypothetical protein
MPIPTLTLHGITGGNYYLMG